MDHSGESEIPFGFGKIFFGKNKPHAWIPPNKSIVLEIRVSELAKSSEHYTDYTFRFPRINHVRRDKIWDESCTLKEFSEMYKVDDKSEGRVMKVVMRNVKKSDIISPSRKRKAATSVKFEHCSEDAEEVALIDNVLEGKEFCVLNGNLNENPSIDDMKRMVRQHGGVITALPRNGKTFGIIVGQTKLTKMVQTYIDRKVFNVIKAEWLVKHFKGPEEKVYKEMPKIRPVVDLIYATDTMKDSLKELYDEYGDSFTENFENSKLLQEFIDNMEGSGDDTDLAKLDEEMVQQGFMNTNFLRNVSAAFFSLRENHSQLQASKCSLRLHAGTVVELEDVKLYDEAIIVIDGKEDVADIQKHLDKHGIRENDLVDFRWILNSNAASELLPKEKYLITSNQSP